MSDEVLILTETRDAVRVITLNRPAQRNALRYESWTALDDALRDAGSSEGVRAVVITGAGSFFSAGGDLKTGPAWGSGPLSPAARVEHAQSVLRRVRGLPVPVVAAVEGAAIGLAWSLVLACDLVVAASDAYFAAPFVARAVVPDGGLAWYLTQHLGRHRASDLLLKGARLPADEARRLGLVTDLASPGTALESAITTALALSEGEAGALEMTKRLITAAEAAGLAGFEPHELAMAVVAQQRNAAADGRSGF
jgi:enoyl-CoA hydratase/carnithine racemase